MEAGILGKIQLQLCCFLQPILNKQALKKSLVLLHTIRNEAFNLQQVAT